jgi:hypothetical protein
MIHILRSNLIKLLVIFNLLFCIHNKLKKERIYIKIIGG